MVSTVASHQEGPGFHSRVGLHVLPVPAWLPLDTPASSHIPKTCKLGVRWIGHVKLPVGVNVSADGCLSLYVSPAVNWRLVQGVRPKMLR